NLADNGANGTVGVEGSVSAGRYTQYSCNEAVLTPGLLLTFALPECAISPTSTPYPTSSPSETNVPTITRTPNNTPIPVATCGPNSNYAITTSTGGIVPGVTDIGNHCDDCNTNIALPFAYRFYGQ